jgi:hypothetical protein
VGDSWKISSDAIDPKWMFGFYPHEKTAEPKMDSVLHDTAPQPQLLAHLGSLNEVSII